MNNHTSERIRRKMCRAVLGLLVGTVAALLAGELLVRVLPHLRVSTVMWAPDDTMGAVLKPRQKARFSSREFSNKVIINGRGQHDYEHSFQKPEAVFRIPAICDSYVE